jgi:DICT domain-containing protein
MPVDIDPTFSVYHLTERLEENRQSSVMYSRKTMNQISYQIENATLIDGAPTRIFSGFQRMSKFLPQAKRYAKIAGKAESVHVFGINDVPHLPQIPNLTYVNLTREHQLAKEWFLVSYNKMFASVLATEEITDFDAPDADREFKGLWSFDVRLAALLEEWLTHTVGMPELMVREENHNARAQRTLVTKILDRMRERTVGSMIATDTQEQLRIVIENTLHPIVSQGILQ